MPGLGAERRLGLDAQAAALVAGYRPLPGVYDELVDGAGRVRPHWRALLRRFAQLGAGPLAARFEVADRQLRASGVSYRIRDEREERPWALSHVPMLLPEADWQCIARGVAQRARLLEAVCADVHGEGRLVRDGILPAALIAGNQEFLRPVHGVHPPGGRFLRLYAADLTRGPDGRWWVIGDRAQAPSGAGYALENRIALSRAFPDLYRSLNVQRLAGFFRTVRADLAASAGRDDPRICVLTPGPLSETYFEHAFLARYLGFLLVEGADLSVHDARVYVGTVEGPRRADVILRRVDGDYCDPVELNHHSRLGVPGLVQAVRAGSVVLANALGSGFVESSALLGFMPALARRLLGEDLLLPNLATWWCGQSREREEVLARLDDLVVAPAFGASVPGLLESGPEQGGDFDSGRRALLAEAAHNRGLDLVGQEAVRLSTTPVWRDGRLVPCPVALRVFVSIGDQGCHVLPGGLARLSLSGDVAALSMRHGGRSADVWVMADAPPQYVTLLPPAQEIAVRRTVGPLPSRVADHLFWFGRYLERGEAVLRIARSLLVRAGEEEDGMPEAESALPVLAGRLAAWGAAPAGADPSDAALAALLDRGRSGSAPALIREALRTATVARERIAADAWRVMVKLDAEAAGAVRALDDPIERVEQSLRTIAAVSGLIHENTNHLASWRFLDLGRRIERALVTASLAADLAPEGASGARLDALLEFSDSRISYHGRYLAGLARVPVLDLVALDGANPRSIAYQVDRIVEGLSAVSQRRAPAPLESADAAALVLSTRLRTSDAARLDPAALRDMETAVAGLSDLISRLYLVERAPEPLEPGDLG